VIGCAVEGLNDEEIVGEIAKKVDGILVGLFCLETCVPETIQFGGWRGAH